MIQAPAVGSTATCFYIWGANRGAGAAGFAAISDFAPNNVNVTAAIVPEPASVWLMLSRVDALAWRRRQSLSR